MSASTPILSTRAPINHVLVDGLLRAAWWIERQPRERATLIIRPFGRFSATERDEVAREAQQMIDFAAAEAEIRDVSFA